MSRVLVLAAALAMVGAAPVAAQGKFPKGECLQKNNKQKSDDYKACNEKHGTTVTPERSQCFKKADAEARERQDACFKLPDKG
jgi:hypothetical protein